ncbi:MAG: glycosyltransferase family 2 protein, partial [Acidobacteriota bacterium]
MKNPEVWIIILNWNGRDDTLECLESTRRIDYTCFNVVVVDNGSNDDSVSAIRKAFPEVEVLETGENLGFAGGNNVGMRYSLEKGAEYVLLLNN